MPVANASRARWPPDAVAPRDRDRSGGSALVGRSGAWRKVVDMVAAAAATEAVVLIVGEPGTGKSLLASRLHDLSARSSGPFVRATRDSEDLFDLAERGTLHVDEVGDLSAEGQARLLRLIQARDVGEAPAGSGPSPDVRVVATSYRDLAVLVAQGGFRADLLYRINVLRIDVPPLRHRRGDIPDLARHLVAQFAGRLQRPVPEPSALTLARLATHSWPGNVRELQNMIERAMTMDPDHGLEHLGSTESQPPRAASEGGELHLREALSRLERQLIREALRRAGGVRQEAARLLGVDPRNLAYFMRKHGLGDGTQASAPRGRRARRPASRLSPERSGVGAARRVRQDGKTAPS